MASTNNVRTEELKRAQLVALFKVQDRVKACDRDRYGKIAFNLTDSDIADITGNTVHWVRKYRQIIKKQKSESVDDQKSESEMLNGVTSRSRKGKGRKTRFTPEQIREVTVDCANKQRRSIRRSSRRFNHNHPNQQMAPTTVWELRREAGMHPYHRVNAPMITNMNKQHRVALAKFFIDKFESGLLHPFHMMFSDEFMIYMKRAINTKNDIIWAFNVNDIPESIRYNKKPRKPDCIGIFVLIAHFGVWYDIKDEGQSWDNVYFREIIPEVFDFVNAHSEHALMNMLQHDCAPGWKANAVQDLLIELFGAENFIPSRLNQPVPRWPGNSPDLNPVENYGSIIMDIVEETIENTEGKVSKAMLKGFIEDAIAHTAADPGCIENLLMSFPKRCEEIVRKNGGPLRH